MAQTSSLTDIFTYIDDHRQDSLRRLIDYVSLPGISAHGEGIEEVANYIAQIMSGIGLATQVISTTGSPMVFGEAPEVLNAPTVLFYGHYDVQPPDPLDAWITPPFTPTVRNGRLYGRGVADNKGQHFANLLALEALLACQSALPCNVKVLLEGEEEIGSPHMPNFVQAHQDLLKADLIVISDGPVHISGRSQIVFGVRGILSFELRAYGANQDLHSGNWGGVAPNPLWTLVHLLSTMKNQHGEITIEGFYEHIAPPTELEQQALARFPVDVEEVKRSLGLKHFDQPLERGYAERLALWPTLTINGLHGGYGGSGSKTVLPHAAIAKCDIRLIESQTADDIFGKLQAHIQKHAPEVTVIHQGAMDPSKTPLDSPFTEPLRLAISIAQGEEPLLVPALGGSLPQYVFTKTLKIPTFNIPYANADEANHAPNENLELERFFSGIKTGVAVLTSLANQPAS